MILVVMFVVAANSSHVVALLLSSYIHAVLIIPALVMPELFMALLTRPP
jgi:hypothetical protein